MKAVTSEKASDLTCPFSFAANPAGLACHSDACMAWVTTQAGNRATNTAEVGYCAMIFKADKKGCCK